MIFLLLFGIAVGMLVPVQTSVNSRLAGFTRSLLLASFYSFLTGTVLLLVINLAVNPGKLAPSFILSQDFSYIWFTGGLLGVIYLTGNIILLPKIGAALTVIMTVAGQMVIGLMVDTFGWFGAPTQPLGLFRILGIAIMIAGIVFMNYKKRSARTAQSRSNGWLLLGLSTGALPPIQSAINSALRYEVSSFFLASLVSFVVGTLALLVLSLATARRLRFPTSVDNGRLQWWHLMGGPLGAVYVTTNIILLPHLGATLTLMSVIFGQMLIGLAIDHFGLFGIHTHRVDTRRIIGVLMILSGIILLQI
ncbi:DMT family transporter [Salinicoccus hispanicus]|uniref:EamA-like transporter family protein n=1 Tax=Salinicoccus hispanicus TaxID=157225 RepID=A0A6N8U446_9STAP|nr:DMT family transporter [Salinicoccus hispanicus]MXQ52117.1 EamA-like transporter family protein [Salinicoccus hispanicus]